MDKTSQQNACSQATKLFNVPLSLFPDPKKHNLGPPQKARVGSEGAGGTPLPCLYSNNSIIIDSRECEEDKKNFIIALCDILTPYHKKQAQTLFLNVSRLIEKEAKSPCHVGFLTLTFPDNVTDNKEASRRFNSLKTNFLSKYPEFGVWLLEKEQQKRGSWHYHLLICLLQDIRTGVDFEALKNRDYRSASPYLRKIWKDLREVMPGYGFGRSELQPVMSNAEAMGRYIGKYISKHVGQRNEEAKGVRLTSYSQGWVKNSMKFAWNTEGAQEWRRKLKFFAMSIGCQEFYQISEKLGPKWAYKYTDDIYNIYKDCMTIFENKDLVFESPTIKRISGNKIQRQKMETKTEKTEKYLRAVERKKQETKTYMDKLTSEYVDNWLPEKDICNPLEMSLQETKENLENYHMKKRAGAVEEYRNEQSIWILNTGEVIPF